jgi:TonB family protein
LARIEEAAIVAQKQDLLHHMTEARKHTSSLDQKPSAKCKRHLVEVLGNPHTPESEWLRVCSILGDYKHTPRNRMRRFTPERFAFGLYALGTALGWIACCVILFHATHPSERGFYVHPSNLSTGPFYDGIDFHSYMADLQHTIKHAWIPPTGTVPRRTVVLFKINDDGDLLNVQLVSSSGLNSADLAALDAVLSAAPFKALPSGAKEPVDIEFTFDYAPSGTH